MTTSTPPPAPAVQVTGLVKRFGSTTAVDGIDLQVARGELFGLVGPDGAGKTTTLRILAGLMRKSAGVVDVLGVDPLGDGPRSTAGDVDLVRDALGLVPQEHSLYGDLSISENLDFFRSLYGLPKDVYAARRARLLHITRLEPFTERRAAQLSGGMYKKLALSCALLHQPEILLLDEPTNGVDPVSRRELWDLVYELVDDGMCVIVSTPYMDEATRCHRVALMHEGRFLIEGIPSALVAAFAGTAAEVEGGVRHEVLAAVEASPHVVASTPAGNRLRVVIRAGKDHDVARLVGTHGAHLVPVRPDFEDLFLYEVARANEGHTDDLHQRHRDSSNPPSTALVTP